jgi:hypothetical protein
MGRDGVIDAWANEERMTWKKNDPVLTMDGRTPFSLVVPAELQLSIFGEIRSCSLIHGRTAVVRR